MSFLLLYCMWDNAYHCHPSHWNTSLLILNASRIREQQNVHSCPSLTAFSAAGGRTFLLDTKMLLGEIWNIFFFFNCFVWVTGILAWAGDVWSLEEAQRILNIVLFKHKQVRQKNIFGWMQNLSAPLFVLYTKLENSNYDNELGDLITLQSKKSQ